jgi:hypothetical protein
MRCRLHQADHHGLCERAPGTRVLSDGLACFGGVVEAGMKHTAIITGGGRPKDARFKWTNTGLANIKGVPSFVEIQPR